MFQHLFFLSVSEVVNILTKKYPTHNIILLPYIIPVNRQVKSNEILVLCHKAKVRAIFHK